MDRETIVRTAAVEGASSEPLDGTASGDGATGGGPDGASGATIIASVRVRGSAADAGAGPGAGGASSDGSSACCGAGLGRAKIGVPLLPALLP